MRQLAPHDAYMLQQQQNHAARSHNNWLAKGSVVANTVKQLEKILTSILESVCFQQTD